MQNGPSGLVAAKTQYALQAQGVGSVFLAGDVPTGSKPDPQLSASLLEDRPRCGCRLIFASCAYHRWAANGLGLRDNCALRALRRPRHPHHRHELFTGRESAVRNLPWRAL